MVYILYIPPEYNPYDDVDQTMYLAAIDQPFVTYASAHYISYRDFATQNLHSFVTKFSWELEIYNLNIYSLRKFLKTIYNNPR